MGFGILVIFVSTEAFDRLSYLVSTGQQSIPNLWRKTNSFFSWKELSLEVTRKVLPNINEDLALKLLNLNSFFIAKVYIDYIFLF
jgi:hypothetical protein